MQVFSVKIRLVSLLVALLLSQGCGSGEQREHRGHLYFGIGNYLAQLDLRDGSVAVLANLGDTTVREVGRFGDEQLLLTVFGPVNHKDTFRLMHYELEGGGLATLFNGRHGRYLSEPEALIYDDGAHLKARLYGKGRMNEVTVVNHRFGARAHVLQISPTRFLYSTQTEPGVFMFDVDTRESQPLPGLTRQCGLDGAIWVDGHDALLCKQSGEVEAYVFVSLAGDPHGALDIPDAAPFHAVAYLYDQDAIVLTERWHTIVGDNARHAVWIYDLADDGMVRLVKDQYLGTTVVYSGA